jgi:membrane protein YqaA with SNARE-associated domain
MAELLTLIMVALLCGLAGGLCGYQMARHIEQARSREARRLLRELVEVADTSPFACVAFVVEHCLDGARELAREVRHAD